MKKEKVLQKPEIEMSTRETKKFLSQHGFSDGCNVNEFLQKVHSATVSQGKSGRVPIPMGILEDHGISTKMHAEISSYGSLKAIKL
jgi:hypothetical protein